MGIYFLGTVIQRGVSFCTGEDKRSLAASASHGGRGDSAHDGGVSSLLFLLLALQHLLLIAVRD